ncbi:UTRA domain-containing protein [Streptomyces sp. NPDC005828]|uniref:UTRA domain-containing protein n=1 Tax=Streptomyces sp. NPDC005828 TaxID=3157071 RepID=UPI0033F03338
MAIAGEPRVVLLEVGPLAGAGVAKWTSSPGVRIEAAVEVPCPSRATRDQANLLGISLGDSLLLIERSYYDEGGSPVESADIVVLDVRREAAYEFGLDRALRVRRESQRARTGMWFGPQEGATIRSRACRPW